MNFRQANVYYRQEVELSSKLLTLAEAAVEAAEEHYLQQLSLGSNMAIAQAIRGGYASASFAHDMMLAYANAAINVAGSRSRFGRRARAEAAHAELFPRLTGSKSRVEEWERRAAERSVTLPVEGEGVEIARMADAELRDIYRDRGSGVLDAATAEELIRDVATRFNITDDELVAWRTSQGFTPPP